MFTFLFLFPFVLIVKPIIGTTPGSALEPTEDKMLDSVYQLVKDLFELSNEDQLTMDHFHMFVGDTECYKNIKEDLFKLSNVKKNNKDSINNVQFRIYIRIICFEIGMTPLDFTIQCRSVINNKYGPKFDSPLESNLAPDITEDEILDSVYEIVKNWFALSDESQLTMDHFNFFVGNSIHYKNIIEEFFRNAVFKNKNIGNINNVQFRSFIRMICIAIGITPLDFTNQCTSIVYDKFAYKLGSLLTLGTAPNTYEDKILDGVYQFVKGWFQLSNEAPLTMDHFKFFVNDSLCYTNIIDNYLKNAGAESKNIDNINSIQFRILIKTICNVIKMTPLDFTDQCKALIKNKYGKTTL